MRTHQPGLATTLASASAGAFAAATPGPAGVRALSLVEGGAGEVSEEVGVLRGVGEGVAGCDAGGEKGVVAVQGVVSRGRGRGGEDGGREKDGEEECEELHVDGWEDYLRGCAEVMLC